MEHLRGGTTAAANTRYVTPEETGSVLAALPDAEWKLLFGLARLAGLRTPSETHLLTWADVDWERARLNVRSPKTEHHEGHDRRTVPITPHLISLLQDRFDEIEPGQERLVTMPLSGHARRTIDAAVKQAGVKPWDDQFQTLRRSCEIEWAMVYPQYAVSRWIGHSITVSGKHYANTVPDELFERVAGQDQAAQNAAQQAAESTRTTPKNVTPAGTATAVNANGAASCGTVRGNADSSKVGATGFEPATFRPPV